MEIRAILYTLLGFPCGSAGKESACNARDLGLIPGLRRSFGEGKGHSDFHFNMERNTLTGEEQQWKKTGQEFRRQEGYVDCYYTVIFH